MTSSGLEMPPDQKASQMRSIWFLMSPVSMSCPCCQAIAPSLRHDRVAAVDDDRLAGDEVVVGDQAHDGQRDVVGLGDTTERRALGAALHQAIVVGAERGLHPPALHPTRCDRVD